MAKPRWQPPHPDPRFERQAIPKVDPTGCQYRKCGKPLLRTILPFAFLCENHAEAIWRIVGQAIAQEHGEIVAAQHREHMVEVSDAIANRRRADRVAGLPRNQRLGFIYYLRFKDTIKIGWASDVAKRMRAYPPGATLLAVHPGTLEDESNLHARFTPYKESGREWYTRAQPLLEHIAGVVKDYGTISQARYMPGRRTHGSRMTVVRG